MVVTLTWWSQRSTEPVVFQHSSGPCRSDPSPWLPPGPPLPATDPTRLKQDKIFMNVMYPQYPVIILWIIQIWHNWTDGWIELLLVVNIKWISDDSLYPNTTGWYHINSTSLYLNLGGAYALQIVPLQHDGSYISVGETAVMWCPEWHTWTITMEDIKRWCDCWYVAQYVRQCSWRWWERIQISQWKTEKSSWGEFRMYHAVDAVKCCKKNNMR